MIRKLVFAGALLLPMMSATAASAQGIANSSKAISGNVFDSLNLSSTDDLKKMLSALPQVMQQMQSYALQQKNNPQNFAMLQLMLLQGQYIHAVASTLFQQAQMSDHMNPIDKGKLAAAKEAIKASDPTARAKEQTKKNIGDAQRKLEEAVRQIKANETAKMPPGQGAAGQQMVMFQAYLFQMQARLNAVMLAELAN